MATKLNIVAQYAMDAYLKQYRVSTDFLNLDDFIFHCAASAAKFYQALYEKEYARMRADGQKDEVVAFSNDFLSTQILKVEKRDGETFAKLTENVFSFAYDQSNIGVQNVFCNLPRPGYELERSDIDEFWQMKYLPKNNKIFWALDRDVIQLKTGGSCNVQELKVIYVPEINSNNPETELPDGIVSDVIAMAVTLVKQLGKDVVVKEANDNNSNKTLETEVNKSALK